MFRQMHSFSNQKNSRSVVSLLQSCDNLCLTGIMKYALLEQGNLFYAIFMILSNYLARTGWMLTIREVLELKMYDLSL